MSTGSFPETHHHHLLGSQRLSSVPRLRTGSVCGARGTQGGQPPAPVPAGHRQCPARGEGRGETEHAFTALLLCHQCIHTHHQGEKTASNCCVVTAAAFPCFLLRVQQDCSPFPVFVLAPNPWPQQHPRLCQLSHSWEWEAALHHEARWRQPGGWWPLLHPLPRILGGAGAYS